MDLLQVRNVDAAKLFVETGSIILKCSAQYTTVQRDCLPEAPQMRFKDISSRMSCEFILNDRNSLKTSLLLDDYVSVDRSVQILGAACQLPVKLCGIDEEDKDSLPVHAFTLMSVFFLQQGKPATLNALREWGNPLRVKGGGEHESYVEPNDQEGRGSCRGDRSMGKLWVQLLRFCAIEFTLKNHVVRFKKSEPEWDKLCIDIKDSYSSKTDLAHSTPSEGVYLFVMRCLRTSAIYFTQLRSMPMVTQLRGQLLCTLECEPEFDQEEDKAKDKGPPAGSGEADETNEGEDEANSCALVRAHDSDKEDLKLTFIEADDNLDVGPEEAGVASGHKSELPPETAPLHHQSTLMQQLVKPRISKPERTLDDLELCRVADSGYSLTRDTLANGKVFPNVCSPCQNSAHLHEGYPGHRLPERKNLPDIAKNFTDILSSVCQDVMNVCSPHPHEDAGRQELFRELESFIRELYRDAKLTLYGSSCNGFGSVRSDLDICLTLDSNKDGKGIYHVKMIKELARKLRNHPDLTKIVAVTIARVPIVKFCHVPSNLEGDISLYNALALHNTRLLKAYSDIDKRVRILGYTFKHFAKTCNIGNASCGSLSSYAYTLMTIYYLQRCKPPVVPVLQELYQEGQTKPKVIIKGWDVWFFEDIERLQDVWSEFGQNNDSVGELWLGMLTFYTEVFNFKEQVVCIRQKGPLTKLQKMWTSKCIAIEDPFDLDHNVGGGVSQRMSAHIMKSFIKARSLFGTPISNLPGGYSTYTGYFFDPQQLTDGQPPNDRRCYSCGKIGHRAKVCPRRWDDSWEERKAFAPNQQRSSCRTLWQCPDARALDGRTRDQRSTAPAMLRGGIKNQTCQQHQPQPGQDLVQRKMRTWPVHQTSGRVPDGQRHSSYHDQQPWQQQQRQPQLQKQAQQPKEPREQQRAPRESDLLGSSGHPGSASAAPLSLPSKSSAPLGVAHSQLQRALQDMTEARLYSRMGGNPVHRLPPPRGTSARFVAPRLGPPPGPPPFPAANGKEPPLPDPALQTPLRRMQQQKFQAQTQDKAPKRYGQFQSMNMPPPGRVMSRPPGLSQSKHEVQRHGAFLGQRTPHGIAHPPALLRHNTSNHASAALFPNRLSPQRPQTSPSSEASYLAGTSGGALR